MMDSADGNGELVAHASSECKRLCKHEVMRIGWDAAAHKAGLLEQEPAVPLIAQANRFADEPRLFGRAESADLDPSAAASYHRTPAVLVNGWLFVPVDRPLSPLICLPGALVHCFRGRSYILSFLR